MAWQRKTLVLKSSAAAVVGVICLWVYALAAAQPAGAPRWYSVLPPLLAVALALVSRRILLSLSAAVVLGGLLSAPGAASGDGRLRTAFTATGGGFVFQSVRDLDNLQILVFVVLVMTMISVMLVGGGLQGLADRLASLARSPRSARLVTMAAGLVIFIDDYANTMIVGSTFRPITDQQRISREKLAFLVDATAAPIAGIAIISTWIGVEVGYLGEIAEQLEVAKDGYAMFFDALGFRFYCIFMIAFVFFNALSGEDFGPMAAAERRARLSGKLLDEGAKPLSPQSLGTARPHPQAGMRPAVALVPLAALLGVFVGRLWLDGGGLARPPAELLCFSVWRDVFSDVNSIPLLAYAAGVGLVLAVALAWRLARVPAAALSRAVLAGVRASWLPVAVLVLAWSLKGACTALGTGEFLAEAVAGSVSPRVFPGLVFAVAAVTSFATGTSWGTMAILIPTAVPAAFQLDRAAYGPLTVLSVAAILDGAIFGDHCSPISDTTIMSSAASSCDHLAHVRTQIPYSLVVAALALGVGYLPAASGVAKWATLVPGVGLAAGLFLVLRVVRRAHRPVH